MSILLALAVPLATGAGPMDSALRATEAPTTLRAAFTVEMISAKAGGVLTFDPRLPEGQRWKLISARGEDGALDEAAAAWGAEAAPDGRLFPDDLRASLGQIVEVDDLGGSWRLRFDHAPSANDTALDVWAGQQLRAEAWLEPLQGRFLRIDYSLPKPVRGPKGGRLTKFRQTYLLESEPEWGLSYISQFQLEFEAKAPFRTIRQSYTAIVSEATFFFASGQAEAQFVEIHDRPAPRIAAR
ncbi:MAG: hypothetical protein L3J02_07520 [Henriciella sp.]|nr:hypothetical protein [Henriciella sp.]